MTSPFVAVPPSPPPGSPQLIANDGWFPDIDLGLLRLATRLDPAITAERLRESAVNSIVEINRTLAAWRADRTLAGAASMADVPAPQIGGESQLLGLYRRAVHTLVGADLGERLADIAATAAGVTRADELATPGDLLRRAAHWAVSDIVGRPRMTVELI